MPLEDKQTPETLKALLNPTKQPSSNRICPNNRIPRFARTDNCTKA
jgi:hypothetical protein